MGCILPTFSKLPREEQIRIYLEDIAFITSLKDTDILKVKQQVQYDLLQIIRLSKDCHMEHLYLEAKYIFDSFCTRYPMLSSELKDVMEESLQTLDISEIYLQEQQGPYTSSKAYPLSIQINNSEHLMDPLDTVSRVDAAFHLRRMKQRHQVSPNVLQEDDVRLRRGSTDSSRSMRKLIQTVDSYDESMSEESGYGFYDMSENLSIEE